jgi:hypothetical protein
MLRGLLEPVKSSPRQYVEVASRQESDPHGANAEQVHLLGGSLTPLIHAAPWARMQACWLGPGEDRLRRRTKF